MPTYSYPGVYIQELPSAVHSISGVATSIAAFIGWAPQGPTDAATMVLSWMDYQRTFGGLDTRSYLGYAVQQFFSNGGQQAYIVRLASPAVANPAAVAATASIALGTKTMTVTATEAGAWANAYGIVISAGSGGAGTFMLSVVYAPLGSPVQTLETFDKLPFSGPSIKSNYVVLSSTAGDAEPANGLAMLAGGTDSTGAVPASVGITGLTFDTSQANAQSSVTAVTAAKGNLTFTAANAGAWGNRLAVQIQPRPDDYTRFTVSVLSTDPSTQAQTTVETFTNLSLNSTDPSGRYVLNIINEQSAYLNASMGATPLAITHNPAALPTSPVAAGSVTLWLVTGTDGTVLHPGSPAAGFETALTAANGGVNLLSTVPLFNLLVVPGESDAATIATLEKFAFDNTAFLIADCAPDATFTKLSNGPDSQITGQYGANAALYFPWVDALDPLQQVTRSFPPSGFVAGIYAATDGARGVWKAPAGIDAGLVGEAGLTVQMTDQQNGVLNVQAINCLRNFRVYGDVVWGARTLRGNDQIGSQWKYVPVRRLALFLETSLYEGTQWVVFEPNDEQLWSQIRLNVGSFMQGLFLQGAFAGSSPQQAYFVKCDSENNPPASVANGIVTVTVGFAPLYPAEFVVIQIEQLAAQA